LRANAAGGWSLSLFGNRSKCCGFLAFEWARADEETSDNRPSPSRYSLRAIDACRKRLASAGRLDRRPGTMPERLREVVSDRDAAKREFFPKPKAI
jgi:hypothetical protein